MEAMARYLTVPQIPTRHGAPQWHRSVGGLLRNPAYQGQAAYRKTQAVARNRPTKAAHDHPTPPKESMRVRASGHRRIGSLSLSLPLSRRAFLRAPVVSWRRTNSRRRARTTAMSIY